MLSQHRLLALIVVVSALAFGLLRPPFEVNDEIAHFAKAAQLGFWSYPSVWEGPQAGALVPAHLVDFIRQWPFDEVHTSVTARPLNKLWEVAPTDPAAPPGFATFSLISNYPPILYFPQAAGLRVAELLGLPPLLQFHAGRIAGGAVALAMILAAARLVPFGGSGLLILAALPGVGGQLVTYSADSLIFGIAFLTFGLVLRAATGESGTRRLLLALLVPVLTLAKGVYLPIAAAGLAMAEAWRPRRLLFLIAVAIVGVAIFYLWFAVAAAEHHNLQSYVGWKSGIRRMSVAPKEQLAFMLANPLAAGQAIFGTMIERLPVYVVGWIGRFGAFTLLLPWPLYGFGLIALVASAVAYPGDQGLPTLWQRAWWLLIAFSIAVTVHMALYMMATAAGEPVVEGVQGRYFVPALPLVALAMRFRVAPRIGAAVPVVVPLVLLVLNVGTALTLALAYWHW